jgi:hypothetical protein
MRKGDGVVDQDKLNKELDKGGLSELPPNVPPGWLGERGLNFQKVDDYHPTGSAGIVQERTPATELLLIALLAALFFTSPVAVWLVWRNAKYSLVFKVIMSIAILAWVVQVYVWYRA